MIKAIETEYNGYKFRSRLEARWAVFFDAAGIKYEYESEGFEVKWNENEVYRYLPDFYLPDYDVYVEVKPSKTKLYEDAEKISMCIDYGNTPISGSKGLLILGQIPYYDPYEAENIPAFNLLWWHKGVCSELAEFIIGEETKLILEKDCCYDICSAPALPDMLSGEDLIFWKRGLGFTDDNGIAWQMTGHAQMESAEKLLKCYREARQARFEHGEKPMTERRTHGIKD